jgi:hypothetical protein
MKKVKRFLAFLVALGLFAGPIMDSIAIADGGSGVLTGSGTGRCCREGRGDR